MVHQLSVHSIRKCPSGMFESLLIHSYFQVAIALDIFYLECMDIPVETNQTSGTDWPSCSTHQPQ